MLLTPLVKGPRSLFTSLHFTSLMSHAMRRELDYGLQTHTFTWEEREIGAMQPQARRRAAGESANRTCAGALPPARDARLGRRP